MMIGFLRIFAITCVALICGNLVSKLKLPAILGWLIAGIATTTLLTIDASLANIVSGTIVAATIINEIIAIIIAKFAFKWAGEIQ